MEFIKFLGAIGIGAVIVKILDIFWLQKVISRNETTKWLREQRLKYFSEFAEYCETLSLREKDTDVLDFVALGAKIKLLIGTEELLPRVDDIIDRVCDLRSSQEGINMEIIHKFQQDSKKLISDLRYELLKEPNDDSFIARISAQIRRIIRR
jgi:hypothetical protein